MKLVIEEFRWLDWVVENILDKHGVRPEEAEQVFFNPPYRVRRSDSGKYLLYGRTEAGRYLFIVFAWEKGLVRVISARDMTPGERRYLAQK